MTLQPREPNRRRLLALAGGSLAAGCALCGPGLAVDGGMMSPRQIGPHSRYEGTEGPTHWGELSLEFKSCRFGPGQAPIDLGHPMPSGQGGVEVFWKPDPLFIENNGHTTQVNVPPGSSTRFDGRSYVLRQFHFHHPSEHTLSGDRFPMELHFVHATEAGEVAVLAVLLAAGAPNAAFGDVVARMPREVGRERFEATVDPTTLLPETRHFFRYVGSLTTPPCSDPVLWTVLQTPGTISEAQLGAFAGLFPNNARPLQPLNKRHLTRT
jgi:carbonic anhydrase